MARPSLTLGDFLRLFGPLVQYARSTVAVEAPKHQSGIGPQTHRDLIAWTFLFRALNLADAALDAARHKRGETLALIARSMLELAFHVKAMKNNPAHMDAYGGISDTKRLKGLQKWRTWLQGNQDSDPAIIAECDAACQELAGQCKSGQDKSILSWAQDAGMEGDYRLKYDLLCRDTHHNAWALSLYVREVGNGIEVQNHYPEEEQAIYLSLCMAYWSGCMDILWGWCGIRPDREYLKLATDVLDAIKGKAASD